MPTAASSNAKTEKDVSNRFVRRWLLSVRPITSFIDLIEYTGMSGSNPDTTDLIAPMAEFGETSVLIASFA
jgi:hypothetical protein